MGYSGLQAKEGNEGQRNKTLDAELLLDLSFVVVVVVVVVFLQLDGIPTRG
jgi:hypothetical protein